MRDAAGRTRDAAFTALSRDSAGAVAAAAITSCGVVTMALSRGLVGRSAGRVITAAGVALGAGAARHLSERHQVRQKWPAPGRLVEVEGQRMHVLGEGERGTFGSVVWMPGSHAGGFALHHLHRELAREERSILVDRFGSGWSDPGAFPRTTAREVDEVVRALGRAGELPPYVLVGHSFGGLLMANIARRHPKLVRALVLLDATPADTVVYAPRVGMLHDMRRQQVWRALKQLVGWRDGAAASMAATLAPTLGADTAEALCAVEDRPAAALATASIFEELLPRGFTRRAWETAVLDGDLGDLPLYLVAPADMRSAEWAMVAGAAPDEPDRLRRFYTNTRERYLTASTRAQRVYAPAGTGHNFPSEAPEFVLAVVLAALRGTAVPGTDRPQTGAVHAG